MCGYVLACCSSLEAISTDAWLANTIEFPVSQKCILNPLIVETLEDTWVRNLATHIEG